MISYRSATADDVTAIFELYSQIVHQAFPEWNQDSKNKWLQSEYNQDFWYQITKNQWPLILATHDTHLVGFAATEELSYGVAYLGWLGVLPSFQGQKIGSTLLEKFEAAAKTQAHKIELETQDLKTVSFYTNRGYNHEGTRPNSWQHLDVYLLGKNLV